MVSKKNFIKDIIINRVSDLYKMAKSEIGFYKIDFNDELESISGISIYPYERKKDSVMELIKFWKEISINDLLKIERKLLTKDYHYYKNNKMVLEKYKAKYIKVIRYDKLYEYYRLIDLLKSKRILGQVIYVEETKEIKINIDDINYYCLISCNLADMINGKYKISNLSVDDLRSLHKKSYTITHINLDMVKNYHN